MWFVSILHTQYQIRFVTINWN